MRNFLSIDTVFNPLEGRVSFFFDSWGGGSIRCAGATRIEANGMGAGTNDSRGMGRSRVASISFVLRIDIEVIFDFIDNAVKPVFDMSKESTESVFLREREDRGRRDEGTRSERSSDTSRCGRGRTSKRQIPNEVTEI